jgi:hypothetical protein
MRHAECGYLDLIALFWERRPMQPTLVVHCWQQSLEVFRRNG